MKKAILTIGLLAGLATSSMAYAETTVTKTSDGTTTTTITRHTDSDPRVATIKTPQEFTSYAYSRWDKNGDGVVTPDEWDYNVTRWYGPDKTVYKTYAYWDKNHNGKLDPQEFDTVVNDTNLYTSWNTTTETVVTPGKTTEASFNTYDLNGDGSITPSEWTQTH